MTPRESVERFFTGFYAGDAAATRDSITDDFTLIGPFVAANNAAEFFQLAQGLMQIVRGHRVLRWAVEGNTVAARTRSTCRARAESPR
jgi:SnoaL-like domain